MFPSLNVDQTTAAALVGLVLPPLIAVVLQSNWPRQLKSVVSLAIYGVSGVIVAALAGQLTGATAWQSALTVFIAGVTSHRGVWEPTGVTPKIEAATTPGASADAEAVDLPE